jgi:hypothetical protein
LGFSAGAWSWAAERGKAEKKGRVKRTIRNVLTADFIDLEKSGLFMALISG